MSCHCSSLYQSGDKAGSNIFACDMIQPEVHVHVNAYRQSKNGKVLFLQCNVMHVQIILHGFPVTLHCKPKYCKPGLKPGSQYDAGATSVTKKSFFFTSQIASLTLNFLTIWLGRWLTLATLCWNRNRVYSSVTLMLVTLRWHERHIVNQALCRLCKL